MMHSVIALAGALGALTATVSAPPAGKAALQLDPKGAAALRVGYMPIRIALSDLKPAGVTKEPTYAGKPKYGSIVVGNGPKGAHTVVVDEPAGGEFKVWLDTNADGDLTNDGNGSWSKKTDQDGGRTLYGINEFVVRASYGAGGKEKSSADTGIALYRIVTSDSDALLMYRLGVRSGALSVAGTDYKAMLLENDADGLYNKSLGDDDKPLPGSAAATRPVWLILENDGKRMAPIDIRYPFELGGKTWLASASADGSELNIAATTRAAKKAPARAERPPLLANGKDAPDFTSFTLDGKPVKLSDLRGKTVILDFWSTWCGPCKASMPHIEEVWKKTQEKGVVVLAVCVWDSKEAFDKWVPENSTKYTFPVTFDTAGRDSAKSVAGKLFNVSGIPTTFVIDKDGKVVDGIVGYSGASDKRIEAALRKVGVAID
jgi:thiol-disulfide isomerase/thioredoxin